MEKKENKNSKTSINNKNSIISNTKSDIALIGLGVMGKNLVLNLLSKPYKVSVYNRTTAKTTNFTDEYNEHCKKTDEKNNLLGFNTINELVKSLKKPSIIIVMVQSGKPVDMVLEEMRALLEGNDVVLDMGNSHYKDTARRCGEFTNIFRYIGCGISGGEEGARLGPSLMPGCDWNGEREREHYPGIEGLFRGAQGQVCW